MSVQIKELDVDHPDINKVFKPDNPLYASSVWLDFYRDYPIKVFVIYNGSEPVGGFYLYKFRKVGFTIITNPPFSPTNGFILNEEKKEGFLKNTFHKEVHEAIAGLIKNNLRPSLFFTSFPVWVQQLHPYLWAKMNCRPSYTYVLDIACSSDNLSERFSNKVRKCLRVSEKDFVFEPSADKNIMLDLLGKTYCRNKKKYSLEIPSRITDAPTQRKFGFVARKKDSGTPVAFAFCLHDLNTAYLLFNGYDHTVPSSQTVKACIFLCIQEAIKRNLKKFDFEGSMIPSIEQGYREFGGDAIPYYLVSYVHPLWKIPALCLLPDKF